MIEESQKALAQVDENQEQQQIQEQNQEQQQTTQCEHEGESKQAVENPSDDTIPVTSVLASTGTTTVTTSKVSELRVKPITKIPASISTSTEKLHGYAFYKKIGSPQYVCAPMVDQSELAFRMLCRKYGTTVAYSPMIHSKVLQDQGTPYLNTVFSTASEDRPMFAQFCGNEPDVVLNACRVLENQCDAVDLNFGCPQAIAKRGRYGSYLLSETKTIVALVEKLHAHLKVPVCCKIRVLPSRSATLELAKAIEAAGCSILTVHGRVKEQNKDKVGSCDWDVIKQIKEELSIPVFANGGIYTYEDVERCIEYTGVDGVMSAEGLLENPALFSGKIYDLDELALEYLDFAEKYPTPHFFAKSHLFKMLHSGLMVHTDLRNKLANVKTIPEQRAIVQELKKRREDVPKEEKFGWYTRYWDKMGVDKGTYNAGIAKENEKCSSGDSGEGVVTEIEEKSEMVVEEQKVQNNCETKQDETIQQEESTAPSAV